MKFSSENCEISFDGTFRIKNLPATSTTNEDVEFLNELADSLQLNLPDQAERVRKIANRLI